MIYDPFLLAPAVSFHRLRDDAQWLENLLATRNVVVRSGTELAVALELLKQLPDLSSSPPPDFDPRSMTLPLGLVFLSRALRDASTHTSFDHVCRLLPELAGPMGVPAAQDMRQSGDRDLVFELELAAVLASMGADVKSAHEPDVTFTYDHTTWDVACKLIYSRSSVTLNDRVEQGIEQILRFESDYGLVCLGITNRVDHRRFMPLLVTGDDKFWGVFHTGDDAVKAMTHMLTETRAAILKERNVRFFRGREDAKFRGICVVLHAVVGLGPHATILTATDFISRGDLYGELVVGPEAELARQLNERLQNVFTG